MITGIFGFPRAGKTTYLSYLAQRAIKGKPLYVGRGLWKTYLTDNTHYEKVYSTFPLKGCYQLDFETLGHFNYSNCLLLIDEISHFCDCRDWKNFTPELRYFFTMHGHFHTSIIYCGQNWKDCDKKIQNMTQQLLHIEKKGGLSRITPVFASVKFVHGMPEMRFTEAPPLGRSYIRRKKYYSLFDSYEHKPLPDFDALPW